MRLASAYDDSAARVAEERGIQLERRSAATGGKPLESVLFSSVKCHPCVCEFAFGPVAPVTGDRRAHK